MIASICLDRGAAVANRNTNDFVGLGLNLVNPWVASQQLACGNLARIPMARPHGLLNRREDNHGARAPHAQQACT
jgi:hypothetical protein